MKNQILFLLTIFAVITVSSFAQQIPFQGKLYQNNLPYNGTANFTFSIPSVGWSDVFNTQVDSGLYSVVLGSGSQTLPATLFSGVQSRILIVSVQGNFLDSITLYSPIESDPTVPANLKDGVSWNEVQNKPTIDTSFSNEIQTLSYSSGVLSLSQGNSVSLSSFSDTLIIDNFLQVGSIDTVNLNCVQQNNASTNYGPVPSVWQAFTATCSGKLTSLDVIFANDISVNVRIKIFKGIGTMSQQLGSTATFPPGSVARSWQTFNLSSQGIYLIADSAYTFEVIAASNTIDLWTDNNNGYLWNVSSIGGTSDLAFNIHVDQVNQATINTSGGNVGIGNNNPTSELTVGGRIEDKTGFLMPVGSIIPFAGSSTPKGWLFCDGSSIRRDIYSDLFNAIGNDWGSSDSISFNLPDLRGMFLRGYSDLSANDPDKNLRTAQQTGGNSGNNVGSVQQDQVILHNHTSSGNVVLSITSPFGPVVDFATIGPDPGGGFAGPMGGSVYTGRTGGSETRSKNAYVKYIIKY